ncbi:MAG: MFS transporter [Bacteroidia bacterium]|nr:MFS transporter [Bacteroidia bacterium]
MLQRYTIQFWLLCLSTLLFFFSFTIIIPELPDYITSLGGGDYKGFTIGLFTISAGLSRPISGKLADLIGRRPVMIFGGLVCVVVSFFYPLFSSVFGFLFLRFIHGMSTGFMPTGTVAYIADIVPSDRRGEAMGLVGVMNNVGLMSGNALSTNIVSVIGLNNLFLLSGLISVLSISIVFWMKETLPHPQKLSFKSFHVKLSDFWDSRAKDPAIVMLLSVTVFGTIITLIPDYSVGLGINNKGLFVSIMTISTVLVRLFTAKFSDKYGRLISCKIGTSLYLVACSLLMFRQIDLFYISAIICGLASGINTPSIFAWVVDVAKGKNVGRSVATLFIALEAGITIGAFSSAYIYDNIFSNFSYEFMFLSGIILLAMGYLFFGVSKTKILDENTQ